MVDMVNKQILPSVSEQIRSWSETLLCKRQVNASVNMSYEENSVVFASNLQATANQLVNKLCEEIKKAETMGYEEAAAHDRDVLLSIMHELRVACDALETMTASTHWPFPTYEKLLFGIL